MTLHIEQLNNEYKLGYYQNDNTSLIEIKNCPLACRQINTLLEKIDTDKLPETTLSSSLTLRYTKDDGAKYWFKSDRNNSVTHNNTIAENQLLQEDTSFGKFYVPRNSFFQINFYLRDALIKETLNILKENPTEYVFDLFCGVGVFGICAAKFNNSKFFASDIDSNAIKIAKRNADHHNIKNIKFFAMPAVKAANKVFKEILPQKTTLILDPPRTGMDKKLTLEIAAAKNKPKNIIYISCAADTLCRDIKILSEAGYSVQHTKLIDMFPRTAHFESVTLLSQSN